MSRKLYKKLLPVIQAYVEGKPIQFKYADDDWADLSEDSAPYSPAFDSPRVHWRVKSKTKKFRVALLHNSNMYYTTTQDENEISAADTNSHFVKWLTDWIEYEVE